jgi:DNA-directed RNA polymerase subunit M/transcription elongation factor TFIIS
MSRSVRCPQCKSVLNVPADVGEKRLKCPTCATRFVVTPFGVARVETPAPSERSAASSMTVTLEPVARPIDHKRPLPDLLDAAAEADAAALFRDDPVPPRRLAGGDARSRPRTCPDCGAVVPAGMSLCNACGLDLDTGTRADTLDVVEPVADAPHERPPISAGGLVVGCGALAQGVALCVLGAVAHSPAGIVELLAGLFLIYTAVLYLAGRAARPLLAGLMFAGVVALCLLVIAPILVANGTIPGAAPAAEPAQNADSAEVTRHLDMNALIGGVAFVTSAALMMVYLTMRTARRHIRH